MVTFAAAYLIVWLAVVLYIVRLERRQRSLVHTIQSLRSQLQDRSQDTQEHRVSKAA
jgi:CcmD family protein